MELVDFRWVAQLEWRGFSNDKVGWKRRCVDLGVGQAENKQNTFINIQHSKQALSILNNSASAKHTSEGQLWPYCSPESFLFLKRCTRL